MPSGTPGQLVHVAGIEVAHAPVADLAVLLESLERLHRLGQRVRAAPVQQVEVEPVGLQAASRLRSQAAIVPLREALCG